MDRDTAPRTSVWPSTLTSSPCVPRFVLGAMRYPGTALWVPALYGMEIPDPAGSGLMVPVLGMESDGDAGHATPVAGSMEDADGKGRREPGGSLKALGGMWRKTS